MFGSGRGVEGALPTRDGHLQLFDVALRNNAGIAPLQFALGVEFVRCLLQRAFCLLKLAFRLHDIGLRRHHGGIDFGDLALGRQQRGFLLGAVEFEKHVTLLDGRADIDVNLRHPAVYFGHDRDGPVVQRRRRRRRMIVEDHRDQRDREHQAADDAISQLEPNRIERDFVAEALSLPIASVKDCSGEIPANL